MSLSQPSGPIKIDPRTLKVAGSGVNPIVQMARAYVEADVNVQANAPTYTLKDQKANFARVNANAKEGGGFYVLLKQVNDLWVPLLAGQDLPGKEFGYKYGLPAGWFSTEY